MSDRSLKRRFLRHAAIGGHLGIGAWTVVLIAIVSTVFITLRPADEDEGLVMWTRARNHLLIYEPTVERWNQNAAESDEVPLRLYLLSDQALERRMMSGFLAETNVADLIELERNGAGRVFTGPLDDVGFIDLTDRLDREGLRERINEPSFGPWTSRGRVFGLPHDVHPALLGYRADIVEAAGIDITQAETWDDLIRLLRPLIVDLDGDRRADRYLLNFWHTNMDQTELLILQAGGAYFDDDGKPVIASDINARTLAHLVSWICGPDRIAIEAPEFTASGNRLRLEGNVICSLVPDWLCGVWRQDLPELKGKMKLMPLPAWECGGRRTSVWGGSMLGISRTSAHPDAAWRFAKHLYMSRDVAERLYRKTGIISAIKELWSCEFYDEPSPFFSGQAPGRLYIEQAPNVPRRTSSPFNMLAKSFVRDAMVDVRRYAEEHGRYQPDELVEEAKRALTRAEDLVRRQMQRNVFLREDAE